MSDDVPAVVRVGEPAPEFDLPCVDPRLGIRTREQLSGHAGHWLLLMFYPRDFTFVCPTELTALSARIDELRSRDCHLLAISTDPLDRHEEWLATPLAEGGVEGLRFPLGSDVDGAVARAFGIYVEEQHAALRGLFLIDPTGVLQYQLVHNMSVGRSVDELLRVLDALRSGGLCPANWTRADGTIDAEAMLRPGTVLGHYRLRKQLGKGAFGEVYEAFDETLERIVALKLLKAGTRVDPQTVLAEARAGAALSHPGICTVYAVELIEGLPVLAMEFLDGESLDRLMKAGGGDAGWSRDVVRQVADAMAASHAAGVVHGDLKPANVMLTRGGLVKVLDFGVALRRVHAPGTETATRPRPTDALPEVEDLIDTTEPRIYAMETTDGGDVTRSLDVGPRRADGRPVTKTAVDTTANRASTSGGGSPRTGVSGGSLRGTPAYMAPEQLDGLPATPASDVYSLGLILFELLVRERAYLAESLVDLLYQVQSTEADELVARAPEVHRPLLARMLATDPADRITMAELFAEL